MILKTKGGRFRVKVRYRGIIVADRTFERRGEAVRWETEQKRLLHDGDFIPPSAGRATVGEIAAEYQEARLGQVSVRSWESDESALRVHIVPKFGKMPVSSVTPVMVERFLSDLAVSRSVRTAARIRTTLRGLFDYAVRTRRIRTSPAANVRLPRPDSRTGKIVEFEPFTLDGLLTLVETQRTFGGRYADITLVLGLTGIRFGELRGLRVRDIVTVPFPGLAVKRSVPQSARTGRAIERATTKGGRSRIVPLTDRVQPVIAEWATGKDPDDLLFSSPEGHYIRLSNWRRKVRWVATSHGRRPMT